jgi:hypothetical protein
MLSFQFKLTPAQTKTLLVMYCELRDPVLDSHENPNMGMPLGSRGNSFFILTMNSLISKNLADYSFARLKDNQCVYQLTKQGKSVAELIYEQAKVITNMVQTHRGLANV